MYVSDKKKKGSFEMAEMTAAPTKNNKLTEPCFPSFVYLNVTVAPFRDEWYTDGKEVIGLAGYAELQTASLVLYIHHRQTPLQDIPSAVVSILSIQVTNQRCSNTRSASFTYTRTGKLWQVGGQLIIQEFIRFKVLI